VSDRDAQIVVFMVGTFWIVVVWVQIVIDVWGMEEE
jgi:hypothetical protein